jgi:hypothetical protein
LSGLGRRSESAEGSYQRDRAKYDRPNAEYALTR